MSLEPHVARLAAHEQRQGGDAPIGDEPALDAELATPLPGLEIYQARLAERAQELQRQSGVHPCIATLTDEELAQAPVLAHMVTCDMQPAIAPSDEATAGGDEADAPSPPTDDTPL